MAEITFVYGRDSCPVFLSASRAGTGEEERK